MKDRWLLNNIGFFTQQSLLEEDVNVTFSPSISKVFFWILIVFSVITTISIVTYPLVSISFFGVIETFVFWFAIEMLVLGVLIHISFYFVELSEYYVTDSLFVYNKFLLFGEERIVLDSIIRIDIETTIVERIIGWLIRDEVGHLSIYMVDGSHYTTGGFEEPQRVYYELYAQKYKQVLNS